MRYNNLLCVSMRIAIDEYITLLLKLGPLLFPIVHHVCYVFNNCKTYRILLAVT